MHVKCCVLRGTWPYRNSDFFFFFVKKRYSYRIWHKFSFCFHSGMLREKSKSVLTSRNITPSWKQQVHQRFLGKLHNMAISCFSFTWVNKKSLTLQLVSTYIILNRSKYSSSFPLFTKTQQSLQGLRFFSCTDKLEQVDPQLCFPEAEFTHVGALYLF